MSTPDKSSMPSYLQAREAWESGWYRVAANARNWRWLASLLLLVNLVLCLALWQLANRRSTYIVEVDRHGHALAFGPVSQLQVPEERLWRYFLSSFISQLRTIPSDPAVLEGNLKSASSYLRGDALDTVRGYFSDANPWASQRTARVYVEVNSVLRKDKTHWQIEWTEIHQDRIVAQRREERWQALVTTAISPPRSTELILKNPLGFYVVHLDWTRITSKGAL
jgi:type IV secretory pathway TrbF-like protein